ncbi:MAG: hypothetical protein K1X89_07820 [Myxococcaceae bacterium]|nr:hypothetical protein [Myxococcaceae bacterium]
MPGRNVQRLGWFLVAWVAAVPAHAATPVFAGSATLDYRLISGPNPPTNPSPLGLAGLAFEISQKIVVELGHGTSFTVKACGGCHGLEVDQAYGELRLHPALNVRAGRINVPFGEFNTRHDPANFAAPSKPMPYAMGDMLEYGPTGFNLGIVPAPYVDNGAEVFGSFELGEQLSLDYSVYGSKGLAGSNDIDFAASRLYLDNNRLPAFGGRLVLTGDDWAVGASGSAGTYDARDTRWYVMGGGELYARLGSFTFRGEGLFRRTDLDPSVTGYPLPLIDPWFLKVGWYGEVDWEPLDALVIVARSDGVYRFGAPLPGSQLTGATAGAVRQTVGVLFRAHEHAGLKLGYELWTFTGAPSDVRHVGRIGLVLAY